MTNDVADTRAFFALTSETLEVLGLRGKPRKDGVIALRFMNGVALVVMRARPGGRILVAAESNAIDVVAHAGELLARNLAAVADDEPIFSVNPSTDRCVVLRALDFARAAPRDVVVAIESVLKTAATLERETAMPPADPSPRDDIHPLHNAIGRLA